LNAAVKVLWPSRISAGHGTWPERGGSVGKSSGENLPAGIGCLVWEVVVGEGQELWASRVRKGIVPSHRPSIRPSKCSPSEINFVAWCRYKWERY